MDLSTCQPVKKAKGSEIYHDSDVTARVSAVSGGRIQPDYDLNNPRTEESGSHHLSIAAVLRLILIRIGLVPERWNVIINGQFHWTGAN